MKFPFFKIIFVLLIVFAVIAGIFFAGFFGARGQTLSDRFPESQFADMSAGGAAIRAAVVSSVADEELGLGGISEIAPNEAMLFEFSKPDYWQIWMKDMNFPIDVFWLDENLKIVDIKENLAPKTYPKTFTSSVPASYVLETSAGFAENHQIKIGGKFNFLKK